MNEEAIQDAYNIFTGGGYNGTIDDYKQLISTNSEAFSDSYAMFSKGGYTGSDKEFKDLMGIGAEPIKAVEPTKTVDAPKGAKAGIENGALDSVSAGTTSSSDLKKRLEDKALQNKSSITDAPSRFKSIENLNKGIEDSKKREHNAFIKDITKKEPVKSTRKIYREQIKKIDAELAEMDVRDYKAGAGGDMIASSGTVEYLKQEREKLDTLAKQEGEVLKKLKTDRTIGEDFTEFLSRSTLITSAISDFFKPDNEIIELNDRIEEELLLKIGGDNRLKEQLLKGGDDRNFLSLEGKENLIKEAKVNAFKNERTETLDSLSKLDDQYKTASELDRVDIQKKYDVLKERYYKLEGAYSIDRSKGIIEDAFKKTTSNKAYKESLSDSKTLDVISTFTGGAVDVIADYYVSGASLAAGFGDVFTDQKGYSMFDAMGDTAYEVSNLDLFPNSEQESSQFFNREGEFTPSSYAFGKSFSNSAWFTFALLADLKGGDGKGMYSKIGKYLDPKKSVEMAKSVNMAKRAYQLTLNDNLQEAKDMGLDGGKAFVYQQVASTATGAVAMINPDFNFFKSSAGKVILTDLAGSLKSAVTKKAATKAVAGFFNNLKGEVAEEELEAAIKDVTAIGLSDSYTPQFFDAQFQKNLIVNTLASTSVFAGYGLPSTYRGTKTEFYNDLNKNFTEQYALIDDLKSQTKDPKVLAALTEARQQIVDVVEAHNKSPKGVTAKQVDLLINKKKLLEEMKSMDDSYHPEYKEKIEKLNEEIRKEAKVKAEEKESLPTMEKFLTEKYGEGFTEEQLTPEEFSKYEGLKLEAEGIDTAKEVAPKKKTEVTEQVTEQVTEPTPKVDNTPERVDSKKTTKVKDLINRPITLTELGGFKLDTPIEGDMYVDGQQVVIEDAEGNITEIGNVDEVSESTLEELGILNQVESIETTNKGNLKIGNDILVPNRSGIKKNKRGEISRVVLRTEDGSRTVTLRGAKAEDAAYQILLKEATGDVAINEKLEQDEDFQNKLRETEAATEEGADKDTGQAVEQEGKQVSKNSKPVTIKGAPKGTYINVGMLEGKTNKPLTEKQILSYLPKGVTVVKSGIKDGVEHNGLIEDTLLLELSRPLTGTEMDVLLRGTKQEAIPQIVDGEGVLTATDDKTLADYDGEFNPAYFYTTDGKQLSDVVAPKAETTEGTNTKEQRSAIMKQVDNARKAIAKLLPNTTIVTYDSDADYNKALGSSKTTSRGAIEIRKDGKNTIHINLDRANGRTVAHEVFHAVMAGKFSEAKIQAVTKLFVGKLSEVLDGKIREELNQFAEGYDNTAPETKAEEFLSELTGMLADNYTELNPKAKNLIKQWLDKVAELLNLKKVDSNDVINLLNTIAGKVASGGVITEGDVKIINAGVSDKVNEGRSLKLQSNFKEGVFGYEFSYDKNSDNFKELELGGIINKDVDVRDFDGKVVLLHQPDGAFSGSIYKNGELLVEGKGGVFYPIKFNKEGYFWASTDFAAKKMAKDLNKISKDNGGTIFMALTSAPVDKLLSSTTMSNAVLDFFISKSLDRKIKVGKSEVQRAILSAAEQVVSREVGKGVKEFGLKIKINKGETFEKSLSRIKTKLGATNSTFGDRKTFTENLIANIVKVINTNPKAVYQFGEFFSEGASNKYFKGVSKTGTYSISKANVTQALSDMLSEPLTKPFQEKDASGGYVYAILELSGEVEAIESKKHESYPKAVSSKVGNKTKIHLLKDAPHWSQVTTDPTTGTLIKKSRYKKVFPSTGVSTTGVVLNTKDIKAKSTIKSQKAGQITPSNSSNYANLTEDGQGNFVFYHVGKDGYKQINPSSGANMATSKSEASALSKVGGMAMYYPDSRREQQVTGGSEYEVKVPMDRVYDFNSDTLELIDEARELHSKENPNKAFDSNSQLAYVTKVAETKGFDMVVAEWNGRTRAQTTQALKPTDVRLKDGNAIKKDFKNKYEGNKEKGFTSVIPETKEGKLQGAYDKINNERNRVGKYDKLYRLREDSSKYTQAEITELIDNSDISAESKKAYKDALTYKEGTRESVKSTIKSQLTQKQTVDKFKKSAAKSRAQSANEGKTTKKIVRTAINAMTDQLVDRQGSVKRALNSVGLERVVDYMVTKSGHSAHAKNRSEIVYSKVFKNLSNDMLDTLDEVILLRRIIAIDKNRAERGLDAVKHQDGMTGEKAQVVLEGYRDELGDSLFNDLTKRADEYFEEYKKLLGDMRDEGLISQESYELFAEVEYQPRMFLDFLEDMDGNLLLDEVDSSQKVPLSDKQLGAIKTGSEGSQLMDAWYLIQKSLQSRSASIFSNRVNTTFFNEYMKTRDEVAILEKKTLRTKAEDKKVEDFKNISDNIKEDEVVGYTKKSNKPKYKLTDSNTKGFKALYFYENGVQNRILMREDFHQKFTDTANAHFNPTVKEALSLFSGNSTVKTLATGNNPLFFITNTPRDFAFILAFSEEYGGTISEGVGKAGKLKQIIKNNVALNAIKLAIDGVGGVKDVVNNTENYQKFLDYGGGMDYLAVQGKFANKGYGKVMVDKMLDDSTQDKIFRNKLKRSLDKFNLASEMGMRLAVFNKSVSNQLNGRDISKLDKKSRDDIYTKAVRSARELTDFNQGGKTTKAFDAVIPYLNAATQGTRAAINNTVDRPIETTIRVAQIVGYVTASTITAALGAISMFRSEDDEDKDLTNAEIYFKTLETASNYDLDNYLVVPLGYKDEDGNWEYLRIAKAQALSPVINTVEYYIRKTLAEQGGISYNQNLGEVFSRTVEGSISPVAWGGLSANTGKIPLVKQWAAMNGIDAYTGNPLDWSRGNIPEQLEGITNDNVEPFFKVLGEATGEAPVRLQKALETYLTTPGTNPYIGIGYAVGNLTAVNRPITDIAEDFGKDIFKAASRRILKSGSEYNKISKLLEKVSPETIVEYKRHLLLEKEIKDKVGPIRGAKGDVLNPVLNQLIEDYPKDLFRIKALATSQIKKVEMSNYTTTLKYTRNKAVRAIIIAERFGSSLLKKNIDGLDDREKAAIKEMKDNNILDDETIMYYKSLFEK